MIIFLFFFRLFRRGLVAQFFERAETVGAEAAFQRRLGIGVRIDEADEQHGHVAFQRQVDAQPDVAHDVGGILDWQRRVKLADVRRELVIHANHFVTDAVIEHGSISPISRKTSKPFQILQARTGKEYRDLANHGIHRQSPLSRSRTGRGGPDELLLISFVFDGFASLCFIDPSLFLIIRSFLFIDLSLLFIDSSLNFIAR